MNRVVFFRTFYGTIFYLALTVVCAGFFNVIATETTFDSATFFANFGARNAESFDNSRGALAGRGRAFERPIVLFYGFWSRKTSERNEAFIVQGYGAWKFDQRPRLLVSAALYPMLFCVLIPATFGAISYRGALFAHRETPSKPNFARIASVSSQIGFRFPTNTT